MRTFEHNLNNNIPPHIMYDIQGATFKYSYRGIQLVKSPFDIAIYMSFLQNVKPKSIIEIGSLNGGSAIWYADMLNNFNIDGHVYSYDLKIPQDVYHPRVSFSYGDARDLNGIFSLNFLNSLPRPLVVIDDSDHCYNTVKNILSFFKDVVKKDEYIIIEDGNAQLLYPNENFGGGPSPAIYEFLQTYNDFQVDDYYCDMFGKNLTWIPNGFLKKVK